MKITYSRKSGTNFHIAHSTPLPNSLLAWMVSSSLHVTIIVGSVRYIVGSLNHVQKYGRGKATRKGDQQISSRYQCLLASTIWYRVHRRFYKASKLEQRKMKKAFPEY
jgi:hypothetical protein